MPAAVQGSGRVLQDLHQPARPHGTETRALDCQRRLYLPRPGPQRDAAHQSAGADHHLFPRGPGLPRVAAMIFVLIYIYSLSLASQRDSSPAQSLRPAVLRFCPFLGVPARVTSSLSRLSSGTAKGTSGCARRHRGLLLFRTPPPKQVWVPFPKSGPGHLGAAIPRVRPG
jgi:hypothetical protein